MRDTLSSQHKNKPDRLPFSLRRVDGGSFGRKGVMSTKTPQTFAAALVATLVVLAGLSYAARAQTVSAPATRSDPVVQSSSAESAAPRVAQAAEPANRTRDAAESADASEIAYPPSPLQTAGALAGALLAIALAIAGVTVTFRSMRNEMRRGRGWSRRPSRSDRTTLPQT
jgi:hypothetical protein